MVICEYVDGWRRGLGWSWFENDGGGEGVRGPWPRLVLIGSDPYLGFFNFSNPSIQLYTFHLHSKRIEFIMKSGFGGFIMRKLPDVALLRKFFSYNPETGEITRLWLDSVPFEDVTEWGRAISNGRCAGKICERIDKFGYVKVTVGRRVFPAHRVAYAVHHGYDP